MRTIESYIGDKFTSFTVIGIAEPKRRENGKKISMVVCRCQCGKVKELRIDTLKLGVPKSCGCARPSRKGQAITHGLSRHPAYQTWWAMKIRCEDPKAISYKNYGGRGISICDEWSNCPAKFIEWALQNGYKRGLTLDRIDNYKGYSPDNCRFVTHIVNCQNKRSTIYCTYKGEVKTLTDWCREFGFSYSKIYIDHITNGVDFDTVINCWKQKRRDSMIELNGEIKTRPEWCKHYGIAWGTVKHRINELGWDFEKALSTPLFRPTKRKLIPNQNR